MTTTARLEVLSKEALASRLEDLIAIDRSIEGDSWGEAEFRVELPGKFRYSRVAIQPDGAPIGFVIASLKEDHVHVHRLAVAASRRGAGVGHALLAAAATAAREDGLGVMTLKVSSRNEGARLFYRRLGFEELEAAGENRILVARNDLLARDRAASRLD